MLKKQMNAPAYETEPMRTFVESRVNGGMITAIDPADIPTSALVDAKNCRIDFDKTSRRYGSSIYGPTAPDSNSVLVLYSFQSDDGNKHFLRFTRFGVQEEGLSSWNTLTGTLTGSDNDNFSITYAFNQCVFTNGKDPIQAINIGVSSFGNLGNATEWKFVTSFYNRIIAAFRLGVDPKPNFIGWSADAVLDEWDPFNDFTAGFGPLIDSPRDTSDSITGLDASTNVLIIPRQKTIWLATKNPSASNPFNAYPAVNGYGCDCPYSWSRTPMGSVFADYQTKKIYIYNPVEYSIQSQQEAQVISTSIENEIFKNIDDLEKVKGSYGNNKYSLIVPEVGAQIKRIWTFDFISKSWVYDERPLVTYISDNDVGSKELVIGDFTGAVQDFGDSTLLDISSSGVSAPARLYAFSNGKILKEDPSIGTDDNQEYTTVLKSKKYSIPTTDIYIVRLRFEFNVRSRTNFRIYWSKNGIDWNLGKSITVTGATEQKNIYFNKHIKARKFQWRIESSNGDWDLIDYEIQVYDAAISSK